jgi:hypothetical protein
MERPATLATAFSSALSHHKQEDENKEGQRFKSNTAIFDGRKYNRNTWTSTEAHHRTQVAFSMHARLEAKRLSQNMDKTHHAIFHKLKQDNEFVGTGKHVGITHRLFKIRNETVENKEKSLKDRFELIKP